MEDEKKPNPLSKAKGWWAARNAKFVEGASVPIAQLSRIEEANLAVEGVSPEAVRRLNRDSGLDRSDEAIGTLTQDEHGMTWEPWARYRSLGLRRFGLRKNSLAKVNSSVANGDASERMRIELTDGSVLHVHLVKVPQEIATRLGAPS